MTPDPRAWGIDLGYWDALGQWREPPEASVQAILAAMGAESDHPSARPAVVVLRQGGPWQSVPGDELVLEDGTTLSLTDGHVPQDVPLGYHQLVGERSMRVVVAPGRCPGTPVSRMWGWAAQLYAARSTQSWGIGDLADLRRLGEWSAGQGARMALLNPLHAAAPGPQPEPSPYFASSRCFANPLYLRIEEVPGASELANLDELAQAGRALNAERLIDRERVWALKSEALEAIFARFEASGGDPAFDRFRADRGDTLAGFAIFCALAESHGLPWQDWPEELRRPDGPAVMRYGQSPEGGRRVRYHAWLQWHLDAQLAAAATSVGLVQDLAIGVNSGGADSWLWQETFNRQIRVGAPPDEFNTLGQDWGLPPFDPWRLSAAGYEPYIQTIRAGFRHAGGLRFDHVMGLFRLYWIPEEATAAEGTYVRYPWWDLLDILALEANRAGAYVVGEDLGTVEDHARQALAERGVLSYRLLWFEPERPPQWPEQALGAVTTHDLPTVAGVWDGVDLEAQHRLELNPNEEGARRLRQRLAEWTASADDASAETVIEGAYGALAQAPCNVVVAAIDDALVVEERPNMPGTVDQWPNWRIGLPVPLEELEKSDLAGRIAQRLDARGQG
jgi:4-alpha-glucanotransferase